MRKTDSPKIGWDTGVSVPGAFKLDQLEPVKLILIQKLSNFWLILGGANFLLLGLEIEVLSLFFIGLAAPNLDHLIPSCQKCFSVACFHVNYPPVLSLSDSHYLRSCGLRRVDELQACGVLILVIIAVQNVTCLSYLIWVSYLSIIVRFIYWTLIHKFNSRLRAACSKVPFLFPCYKTPVNNRIVLRVHNNTTGFLYSAGGADTCKLQLWT